MHDDRLTLRINGELKEAFKRHCREKGLSICHILEGLIYGSLKGFYDKFELDVKSPTINLTLVRDVKRVRRYVQEPVEEVESKGDRCHYCRKEAVDTFVYVPTNMQYPLCKYHAKAFVSSRGNWRVVQKEDSVKPLGRRGV